MPLPSQALLRAQDLSVYQGDDWAATVAVTNYDGSLPDLTGWTAQAQFRIGTADQVPTVAAEVQCTVVPPNNVSCYLSHQQTTLLVEPTYQWDFQLTSPAGDIVTLLRGTVGMCFEVTREPAAAMAAARREQARRELVRP
jgi:hypothetical protein